LLARNVYFYFALNHLWQNHTKHGKYNKIIKHTNMASVALRQIIGGGALIIKNRLRDPEIGGGGALSGPTTATWPNGFLPSVF